jgi:hypothetical protein
MPITINLPTRHNVVGNQRQKLYNLTGTGAADVLATNLNNVQHVNVQLAPANSPTVVAIAAGGLVTFTAAGAWTTPVEVIGN